MKNEDNVIRLTAKPGTKNIFEIGGKRLFAPSKDDVMLMREIETKLMEFVDAELEPLFDRWLELHNDKKVNILYSLSLANEVISSVRLISLGNSSVVEKMEEMMRKDFETNRNGDELN